VPIRRRRRIDRGFGWRLPANGEVLHVRAHLRCFP
jgi:hypothetical protein